MPVTEIALPPAASALRGEEDPLLALAAARIEAFVEARSRDPIPGFVPCDFGVVAGALAAVQDAWLAPGELFLEWGSGFGVVAMLAARLGFSASGIEIQPDLVREARRLAADLDLDVTFALGSFVPEGGEDLVPPMGEFAWLETDAESAYGELGYDVDDFDVIFAYPWPGEEEVVVRLFDRYAARGALLLTYLGKEGVRLVRKTRARSSRRR